MPAGVRILYNSCIYDKSPQLAGTTLFLLHYFSCFWKEKCTPSVPKYLSTFSF